MYWKMSPSSYWNSHLVVIRIEGKNEGGRQGSCPDPAQGQYSRVTVGFLLVALVVLHVECHLAGLAMEACFMPKLGTEAEGRYPSDTRTLGGGSGPRKACSIPRTGTQNHPGGDISGHRL